MAQRGDEHLTPSEIEALASGARSTESARAHLKGCSACRERLERVIEELAYLRRVRELSSHWLPPLGAPQLPGYRVVGEAGVGAQGVVYRAIQQSTDREVAIKVVEGGDAGWRSRREAEIVGGLRHPGIVTVHEARVIDGGCTAIVMEYVTGAAIDTWADCERAAGPGRERTLATFIDVCTAVHHAHLNGVIHRDIKPKNILVRDDGSPVVLDFGIARRGESLRTHEGTLTGTPAYASPEQVSGDSGAVDALTDVYSLGVLLYRMLSGALPYTLDGSLVEMAGTICSASATPLRQVDPSIPLELERVVGRALEKEKRDRYQSAAGLGADVDRYIRGLPVEACGDSAWYLARKLVSRHRRPAAGVVFASALTLVAIGIALRSVSLAAEAQRRAEAQREQARLEEIRLRAVTELFRQVLPSADPEKPEIGAAVAAGLSRLYFRLDSGAYMDDPELDQEIRRLWGSVYTGLGTGKGTQFVEYAEVALRNGLVRLREEDTGADSAEVASGLHGLGGVLLVRGRLEEAERHAREALDMRVRVLGPEHPDVGESLGLLARICLERGRPGEAVGHADRAIGIMGGNEDTGRGLARASMVAIKARAALDAGDAATAEPLVTTALRARLRGLLPDDPALLESLQQAGELAVLAPGSALGENVSKVWGGTETSARSLIDADIRLLRGASVMPAPMVARTGRTAPIARVLRLQEALLGPDDPAAVGMLMAQFQEAWVEGLLDMRVETTLRAADILGSRFGGSDLSVLMCLEQAAVAEVYAGRADRAVPLGERAVAIWSSIPDGARDELLSANTRRRLAWYLDLSGQHEGSVREYEAALALFSAQLPPDHYLTALTRSGLAMGLASCGDLMRADAESAEAARVIEHTAAIPPDTAAHIQFSRGHVLRLQGNHGEARAFLEGAWADAYGANSGTSFEWRRLLIEDMIDVCTRLGDDSCAQIWRARLPAGP